MTSMSYARLMGDMDDWLHWHQFGTTHSYDAPGDEDLDDDAEDNGGEVDEGEEDGARAMRSPLTAAGRRARRKQRSVTGRRAKRWSGPVQHSASRSALSPVS
jgi:hypothetical protein